jgi:hypothetical protein
MRPLSTTLRRFARLSVLALQPSTGGMFRIAGGSLIGTQPRVAFEVNAGGGVKILVDKTWGMRTDARWFKSFGRNASEHFRVSHGVSFDVRKRLKTF